MNKEYQTSEAQMKVKLENTRSAPSSTIEKIPCKFFSHLLRSEDIRGTCSSSFLIMIFESTPNSLLSDRNSSESIFSLLQNVSAAASIERSVSDIYSSLSHWIYQEGVLRMSEEPGSQLQSVLKEVLVDVQFSYLEKNNSLYFNCKI